MRHPLNRTGFSLLELIIVIMILGILVLIFVPYLLESKRAAESTAAQGTLRSLASAEAAYTAKTSPRSFAGLDDLADQRLIDNRFSSGIAAFDGYEFYGEHSTVYFTIWARPMVPGTQPIYYINHSYAVYYANGTPVSGE
jgi:prepilin-type N-terminal cleavage/methylation domain-containing protein